MTRHTKETLAVDIKVGIKITERRISMGMSLQQLSDKIGVSHQQLQKYEKGTNRISIGRMVVICRALKKKISYFVDETEEYEIVDYHLRMQIEVSRNFGKIKVRAHREAVNKLVLSLSR